MYLAGIGVLESEKCATISFTRRNLRCALLAPVSWVVSDVRDMEEEIINQLELIRIYVFIIMAAVVLWALVKILESSQRIIIGFKKAWNISFNNRMEKYCDLGEYKKVLKECGEVLEKYPFHKDAIWYMARAHYGENNYKESIEFFKKAVDLVPYWEDSANDYIAILNQRLNIYNG